MLEVIPGARIPAVIISVQDTEDEEAEDKKEAAHQKDNWSSDKSRTKPTVEERRASYSNRGQKVERLRSPRYFEPYRRNDDDDTSHTTR
jgi:hypothetical protein